jgi:hypothetical protein
LSKSGIIKGDRYESKKSKGNKQDVGSSMEFDAGSQEGMGIGKSKSQIKKNISFGLDNNISAIQRDHDDIINLNFNRKNNKKDAMEDPSQVYGLGKKKGKKGANNRSS